ncbi:uncharacterized protein LOC135696121 [Rhopilema esculentum]|uniref:uncharacterized protein LOC135696121 n=1 Tax=Rhopilema esculentum TaxID=499914 RepID=UPI0031CE5E79
MKREKVIVCSNTDKNATFNFLEYSSFVYGLPIYRNVEKFSYYVTTAKMDNVYVVEPNLNAASAPNTIVVLERNEERDQYPNRLAEMCNEKLGFGQCLCGGILAAVGFAPCRNVPHCSRTTEMWINIAGGFLYFIIGMTAVQIFKRKATKCQTALLAGLNAFCLLAIAAFVVISTLNLIECSESMCKFSRGLEIAFAPVASVLSVCQVVRCWRKIKTIQIHEEVNNDSDSVISNEQSMTTPIIMQDSLQSSTSVPESQIAERCRGTSGFPQGPPPPYE